MKIRITYADSEREKKKAHEDAVKALFPDAKVRETAPKGGYLHAVISVPKPKSRKETDP